MWFAIFKFLHILLAIVAVGFNISYAIWLSRGARDPQHLDFALRGVKLLDDRFANPAYLLLLVTGLTMVFLSGIPLTTFWIAGALVLWFIAVLIGFLAYTPTLRKQIETLGNSGPDSSDYKQLSSRGQLLGIVLAIIVIVILILMVFKPTI